MTSPDQPVESPAELLERAADRIEAMAAKATEGPWWDDYPEGSWWETPRPAVCGGGKPLLHATDHARVEDLEWIATLSPVVATPLVAWLRYESRTMRLDIMGSGDTACTWKYVADRYGPAIAFARLILGETDG